MKKYIVILITMFLSVGAFVGFYKGIEIYSEKAKSEAAEVKPPVYKVNSVGMVNVLDSVDDLPVIETVEDSIFDITYTLEPPAEEPAEVEDIAEAVTDDPSSEENSEAVTEGAVAAESPDATADISEDKALEESPDTPDGVIVMYVTEDAKVLNIRAEHNTTSKIVKTAKSGEEVWVYADIMEEGFYKVYTEDGSEKWAYSTFLTKTP